MSPIDDLDGSAPGLARSTLDHVRRQLDAGTVTPRALSGSATRPVPIANSSAPPPAASSASRSTAGPTTSGIEHRRRGRVVDLGDLRSHMIVAMPPASHATIRHRAPVSGVASPRRRSICFTRHMEYTQMTPEEFAAIDDLGDWRYVLGGIRAHFRAGTFPDAAALAVAIADIAEAADHHPDIDIRYPDRVLVRCRRTPSAARRRSTPRWPA